MNKIYTSLLALCMAAGAQAQEMQPAQPKLSPVTRMLLKDMDKQADTRKVPQGYIYRQVNGRNYLTGMIKVSNPAIQQKLDDLGVIVGTRAGDIWTVNVPYENVKAFTRVTGISYIQLDEPVRPSLNVARQTTRVDSVHKGYNLPWPMTGEGVVVGVMDFGFDYGHPGFFDTSGTKYRVKKVWEQGTNGTPPATFSYGHEVTGDAAIQAQNTDNTTQSHGTAVAGLSSGSGYGVANGKFRGVGFAADMVFVGVRREQIENQWMTGSFSDFVDGVKYMFDYGTSVNKPTVVNISWGSQSGPHDGSSLINQAYDNMSGSGKVVVMSAGNEGQENIHLSKTFTATDTAINTFVTFSDDSYKRTWLDIWGDTAKTFCAKITLYSAGGVAGNTTGYVCIDDQTHSTYLIGANGQDTCYVDFITSSSEYNQKPRVTVNIYNKASDSIAFSVKGTDGSIDIWDEYYYYGYTHQFSSAFESLGMTGFVNGNTQSTVSDMGAARSTLLVGAYMSKKTFTNLDGQSLQFQGTVADIAAFSSRGPMANGRISPDIAAPGLTVATAMSSFDARYLPPAGINKNLLVASTSFNSKTYYYSEFSGTSCSSPMAAGIVSLMLQANPKLNPQQVHDIIAETAIEDNRTGNLPPDGDNTWGHGKINAYGAVRKALAINSVYDFKGTKLDCAMYPNPNNGNFTLLYAGEKNETLSVKVYDIKGSIVATYNWSVARGENSYSISLPQLAKGNYVVQVASAAGSVSMKAAIQ